jgi:hypothetical protein
VSRSDLSNLAALRDELFELDIRFGDIGPDSLFASLEREGVIAAGTVGTEAIARAAAEPPPGGRAALRASWIRHLHPERDDYACDWIGIRHLPSNGWLDLSDPFGGGPAAPSVPGPERVDGVGAHAQYGPLITADVDREAAQ